ncbi:MAG: hypothetical protein PUF50_02475 [Erysipelotrichaceae bacterium]|nr:hypothetical protein [Erysipelotrichaceae bacterium]
MSKQSNQRYRKELDEKTYSDSKYTNNSYKDDFENDVDEDLIDEYEDDYDD